MPDRPPRLNARPPEPRPAKRFGAPDRLRASVRWRNLSAAQLRRHPLCQSVWCVGQTTPATETHHRRPLVTHPHLAYDPANLASVCPQCHPRLTAMERAGKDATPFVTPNE
jgi:5-methylcytosine-specific restriction endonuclease McrA